MILPPLPERVVGWGPYGLRAERWMQPLSLRAGPVGMPHSGVLRPEWVKLAQFYSSVIVAKQISREDLVLDVAEAGGSAVGHNDIGLFLERVQISDHW